LGPGDLPQEGGLGEAAVAYGKGCYVGQEVMSRLKTRGRLRRRLCRVRWAGARPPLPAPVLSGDRRVGELRSAVPDAAPGRSVGFAMLPAEISEATGLTLAVDGEPRLEIL
ncbi:MAG: aminomethyl transferase family protein, partial [Opitutaceae bacterium]